MNINEEDVIGFDALYESMMKTKKGVLWKDSVAAYYHRGIERTERLSQQLHDGTYKPCPPKHFSITSPKPREIASIAYRDRVYQRSLNDNVVYIIETKYECSPDNKWVYSKDGKLYDKKTNQLIY